MTGMELGWLLDHALFVIAEKNRRFGEASVVMRRTHKLQNEKLFATELTTEQPSSTYIYLLSVEIFLRSHFPSESCFQRFPLCIPVLHCNGTSCRIFLLPHKVLFYGNLFIKSTPSCTSTQHSSYSVVILSEQRQTHPFAQQCGASVPPLNSTVMFSNIKAEKQWRWWTAAPWHFEKWDEEKTRRVPVFTAQHLKYWKPHNNGSTEKTSMSDRSLVKTLQRTTFYFTH